MRVPERTIDGRRVGHVGFGAGLVGTATHVSLDQCVRVVHAALDHGTTFLDTALCYAASSIWMGQSERVVGEALRRWSGDRSKVVVGTKGGHVIGGKITDLWQDGRPENLRADCERSLRNLGQEVIDLYHLHSVDAKVPIEESVGALLQLRAEGKILNIGLSNVGKRQIAQAQAVAPIASVENRFSVLDPRSRSVQAYCQDEGILYICYSPTGRERAPMIGEVLPALGAVATRRGATPQQVALSWLVYQGDNVLPIPGVASVELAIQNAKASELELSSEDLAEIDASISTFLGAPRDFETAAAR